MNSPSLERMMWLESMTNGFNRVVMRWGTNNLELGIGFEIFWELFIAIWKPTKRLEIRNFNFDLRRIGGGFWLMNHDTLIKRYMMLKAMDIWRTQLNMMVMNLSLLIGRSKYTLYLCLSWLRLLGTSLGYLMFSNLSNVRQKFD